MSDERNTFDIYVPTGELLARERIDARSGIVGTPVIEWFEYDGDDREDADAERMVIDFEGNRYGAQNIVTYADRLVHAAGRHREHYPTVARLVVDRSELVRVGTFDLRAERARVDNRENRQQLAEWLGVAVEPLDGELVGTSIRAV